MVEKEKAKPMCLVAHSVRDIEVRSLKTDSKGHQTTDGREYCTVSLKDALGESAGSLILERGTVDVGDEFEVLHVFKQRKLKE